MPKELALKVADSVHATLGYWDRDLRCRFANAAYNTWFGRGRPEVLGMTLREVLGPSLFEQNFPYIRAALEGRNQSFERLIELPDGTVRNSLATYTPDFVDGVVQGFVAEVTDLSPLKRVEERFKAAADTSLSAFFILESVRDDAQQIVDFRFEYLNKQAEDLIQRPAHEVMGKLLCDEVPINRTEGFFEKYKEVALTGVPMDESVFVRTTEIKGVWLRCQAVQLGDGIALSVADISDLKQTEAKLAEALEFNQSIIDASPYSIIVTDLAGAITAVNPAAERMLYYSRHEMVGKMSPLDFHDPHEIAQKALDLSAELGRTIEPDRNIFRVMPDAGLKDEGEWTYIRKDGSRVPIQLTVTALMGLQGDVTGYMGIAYDITERKRQEDYISHIAHHDALTNLPTRMLFRDRVEMALHRIERYGGRCALLLIDLDNFKDVNDSLGHHAGDEVLISASNRMKAILRATDTVSRLGGDEFTILLDQVDDEADAAMVARKILSQLAVPTRVGSDLVTVTASIGISVYPEGGSNMAHLLRSADAAMYFAKQSGKQGYRIFTQGLADANTRRIQVETALKGAIGKPEFSVVYQPQLSIEANRIVGFEALARWKHPRLDDVSPSEFIPIAENSGLIGRLGEWVLETACMDAKHIFTAAGRAMRLAVNLSPKQLEREGFLESLQAILARTGFPAHQLEIEITEGLLISDSGTVWSNLRGLQGLGVQTAIDDFGTGFSNISYLLKLQVNRIKIDRSFIANLETDSGADAVVGALIGMAGSLGVGVVAEGVETEGQLRLLREKSCDEAQGYLLYRPMSVARLCEVVGDESGGLPEEGHPVSPPARAGKEADSLRE